MLEKQSISSSRLEKVREHQSHHLRDSLRTAFEKIDTGFEYIDDK